MFKMIAYHMQKRGRDLDESSTITQQQNQSGQYPPQQPAPQQQQHQRAPFQNQAGQYHPQQGYGPQFQGPLQQGQRVPLQYQGGQYPQQQPAPQQGYGPPFQYPQQQTGPFYPQAPQHQNQRAPFQTQGGQHPPQPLRYQGFQPRYQQQPQGQGSGPQNKNIGNINFNGVNYSHLGTLIKDVQRKPDSIKVAFLTVVSQPNFNWGDRPAQAVSQVAVMIAKLPETEASKKAAEAICSTILQQAQLLLNDQDDKVFSAIKKLKSMINKFQVHPLTNGAAALQMLVIE